MRYVIVAVGGVLLVGATVCSGWNRLAHARQWYLSNRVIVAVGGVLPFGSIFIEIYFIFTSFWNYKFYCE